MQENVHYMHDMAEEEGEQQGKEDAEHHLFYQGVKVMLSKHWLLLDNQSTVDPMMDPVYPWEIHAVKETIKMICNAGVTSTDMKSLLVQFLCILIQLVFHMKCLLKS